LSRAATPHPTDDAIRIHAHHETDIIAVLRTSPCADEVDQKKSRSGASSALQSARFSPLEGLCIRRSRMVMKSTRENEAASCRINWQSVRPPLTDLRSAAAARCARAATARIEAGPPPGGGAGRYAPPAGAFSADRRGFPSREKQGSNPPRDIIVPKDLYIQRSGHSRDWRSRCFDRVIMVAQPKFCRHRSNSPSQARTVLHSVTQTMRDYSALDDYYWCTVRS